MVILKFLNSSKSKDNVNFCFEILEKQEEKLIVNNSILDMIHGNFELVLESAGEVSFP
jgi:hypothetical protein